MNLAAIVVAASLAIGGLAGGTMIHAFDQNKYDKLVIKNQKDIAAAVASARKQERDAAKLSQATAVKAAKADQQIQVQTRTIIRKVPTYVTAHQDAVGCVTYGLVRVLDAASRGLDPASLGLPAGQSDDACSPVKPSDLGRSVADNYGASRQNAAQLDALIQDIRERIDIANGQPYLPGSAPPTPERTPAQ